jgi:MFS family permease
LTLAAMTLANSMILVDQTSVPLATPDLIQDLGGSISEGPWILTANILPLAALMVLGGRLGDLLGLRRVFLAGASLCRRSRWLYVTSGRSSAITRQPPEAVTGAGS